MTTDVVTTTPETSLHDAARAMFERKIGCLVVVDRERVVGLIAESDFVKLAATES